MIKLEKGWQWLLSLAIVYALFRFIESIFLYNVFLPEPPQDISVATSLAASSFGIYRDFVTVSTGLLALIVGAIGVGSYVSFKKFKEEEEKIIARRKELEMHLKIEEARIVKGADDLGSLTVVKIYNEAEALYSDYPLLYILRGEEFYLMGQGHYVAAKAEFERALKKEPISSRAWYGLGQTLYKLAIKYNEINSRSDVELKTDDVDKFRLKDIQYVASCEDAVKEAIDCMQKAFSYGFDEALVKYEVGRMYETIKENDIALNKYKESFQINRKNHTTGLYYCSLWIRINIDHLGENKDELNEVVGILKQISYQNLYAGKLAYALLWYLCSKVKGVGDPDKMLKETSPYAIREVFCLPEASQEGSQCSSSTA